MEGLSGSAGRDAPKEDGTAEKRVHHGRLPRASRTGRRPGDERRSATCTSRPTLAEKDRELIETAHEEVRRMKALFGDPLDISKIEAGRIDLKFDRTPVATLFEHARSALQRQLDPK